MFSIDSIGAEFLYFRSFHRLGWRLACEAGACLGFYTKASEAPICTGQVGEIIFSESDNDRHANPHCVRAA
jgi:hypothetical protein